MLPQCDSARFHLLTVVPVNWDKTTWLARWLLPFSCYCADHAQVKLCLSLSEADCFCDLWNYTLLQILNIIYASKMSEFYKQNKCSSFLCFQRLSSFFCYQCFTSSCNQVDILYLKCVIMFMMILAGPINREHQDPNVLAAVICSWIQVKYAWSGS
jgi:hypothetical protein